MKTSALKYLFLFLLSLSIGIPQLYSQNPDLIELEIKLLDRDSGFLEKHEINYSKVFTSIDKMEKELGKVRLELASHSFLASTVDSIPINENIHTAYLQVGDSFKWAKLEKGNVDGGFLSRIGFRERLYSKKPFYYKELIQLLNGLQTYAENHGYPFAVVGLDSIQFLEDNSISAKLNMKKNLLITYSGVEVIGENVKISKKYLESYLGIEEGGIYDLSQIKEIPNRIQELSFLKQTKNPVITFRGNQATVNLFLEKKKASKFDFLVGVLPRNEVTNSRVLITVDGMFSTQNLLGAGEKIFLEFRQPRPQTQKLDIELGYPYIFGLPFGVDFDFSLYKRDSSFIDLEYDGGLSYLFSAQHYLKVFGHSKSSILLEVDTNKVLSSRRLPDNLDTKFSDFGLEYHISDLDYKFNPRKGWGVTSRAAAGFKSIDTNNNIVELKDPDDPEFNFGSLYDSLETRSFQYQLDAKIEGYIPFYPKQRGVFMLANQTGAMISPNPIFLNEQYRLGGTKVIRGFNEEGITASLYSIFTLEYRFIIGRNSYINLFADYGYVESKLPTGKTKDSPLGFGVGMTFDTKVGVFGISYAYGQQYGNPIDFRAAKIHFGYINYF